MSLRAQAERLGSSLPALMAEAAHLASTLMLGAHGRMRAGQGDEFWQYRPALPGDPAGAIDWRRSARGDGHYLREREWQAAQTVSLWVDQSQSMTYTGAANRASKGDRARLLALALAVVLLRGGERVGIIGAGRPRSGRAHVAALIAELTTPTAADYGAAQIDSHASTGRAVYLSDFLGPLDDLRAAMEQAAGRGIRGLLIQILDPMEQDFPFQGRVIFESMAGSLRHETLSAADLRARYLDRLTQRQDELAGLCRRLGWRVALHHTDQPALVPLHWAYRALEAT